MEDNIEFSQKIKNIAAIWPSNSISGYLLKKSKILFWKDIFTKVFITVLFTIAKIWKQPKCPSIDELIIDEDELYIYNGIFFSHKKEYLAICDNMDGPRRYYAKWNKSGRERLVLYDITYM